MAAATGGTVTAGIMDHLESTGSPHSFGGLTSGAAENRITYGLWLISRQFMGASGHKSLIGFRSGLSGKRLFTHFAGVEGPTRHFRMSAIDDVQTFADHYDGSVGDDDFPNPLKDQLWFLAMVMDGSARYLDPDSIDWWMYSPPAHGNYALTKRTRTTNALSNFLINTFQMCIGGWQGDTTGTPTDYCHAVEVQDIFRYGGTPVSKSEAQIMAEIASGKAASQVLASVTGITNRKVWSMKESAAPWKDTFNSGDNLTAVGTVSVVSNFSGVTVMPVSAVPIYDARILSTSATSVFGAATIINVGYNTGGTNKHRSLLKATNMISGLSIPAGSTINMAVLNLQCTTGAAAARTFQVRRVLKSWDDDDTNHGVSWNFQDAFVGTAWQTAGCQGALDSTGTGAATGLAVPTTTGAKAYTITSVIQACLDAGGDINLMLVDENDGFINTAGGTSGVAQFSSREGATPWSIDITYTPPSTTSRKKLLLLLDK